MMSTVEMPLAAGAAKSGPSFSLLLLLRCRRLHVGFPPLPPPLPLPAPVPAPVPPPLTCTSPDRGLTLVHMSAQSNRFWWDKVYRGVVQEMFKGELEGMFRRLGDVLSVRNGSGSAEKWTSVSPWSSSSTLNQPPSTFIISSVTCSDVHGRSR